MNILIIPEDPTNDQYMLRPLFDRLLKRIGYPSPQVTICQQPVLGGIGEALKPERLSEIVESNRGMTDIFILCVDRDGETGRRQRLTEIEAEFAGSAVFLAENAWEEIETWVLAGLDLPSEWGWQDVRAERDVKERYFEDYAFRRGLLREVGGGRKILGAEASRRIRAIRQKCPEDFDSLAKRLETVV